MVHARFIDPTTDFGFKRLFGQEDSKEILKAFLTDMLDLPHPIAELNFIPSEQLPTSPVERISIYDIYCIDTTGRRFIVEMQRAHQSYFRERMLYYITFPIIHQVQKGEKAPFSLLPIYCLCVLDFSLDQEPLYFRHAQLITPENNQVFYEKLTFTFIELPKFKLELSHVMQVRDYWIYLLRHLPSLDAIPEELAREPFLQAFDIAEQAALSPQEQLLYEASLKHALNERSIYTTGLQEGLELGLELGLEQGHAEGLEEGLEQGRAEGLEQGRTEGLELGLEQGQEMRSKQVARRLLDMGMDPGQVAEVTGLSLEEVARL